MLSMADESEDVAEESRKSLTVFFQSLFFLFLGCHKINIFHYFEVLWRSGNHSDANEAEQKVQRRKISSFDITTESQGCFTNTTIMSSIKREFIVSEDNVWHVEASFRSKQFHSLSTD